MLRVLAWLGFTFLYVPLFLLVVFSFNANDRASVWTGFSFKWYGQLLENKGLIDAAMVSLQVASMAATIATVIGVLAAYVLSRFRRFRGRSLLEGMSAAPLVLPDIILGFSILTLFIMVEQLFGWRNIRGIMTITIAHATLCSAYVCVTVSARLVDMDQSLEEAALDLGAKPWQVFFGITLPVIAPAVIAGWLLSFTISMDDAVISQFVSGAGGTTLPVKIWSQVRIGVTPEYNALATLIITLVAVFVISAMLLMNSTRSKNNNGN